MKVFQIVDTICFNDASTKFKTAAETEGKFPPDVLFVDTPDYVFEGWGYDSTKEGDARFIKPQPPEGWEYDSATGTFYNPSEQLRVRRSTKETELSNACNAAIIAGLDIQLGEVTEHFNYSERDQLNIKEMFDAVRMGASMYPYQAEDGACRTYSAQEIVTIYTSLAGNKTAQLTYYHQLKDFVATLESVDEIDSVTYGQTLTGEYLTHYNEMVAVAAEQMQAVVSKISSGMNL